MGTLFCFFFFLFKRAIFIGPSPIFWGKIGPSPIESTSLDTSPPLPHNCNLGTNVLLLLGTLGTPWEHYENRWEQGKKSPKTPFPCPFIFPNKTKIGLHS